jgi:flagellar biosynthesis protein FlhG
MIEPIIEESPTNRPRILAIGGGKGGVGKSVLAVNLGAALARTGNEVVVVDADLGGANLHTLFGISDPDLTLSDFLTKPSVDFNDIALLTPIPGLKLVSGARALLEAANPKYVQKSKIVRHIRGLDADHVILDLGAGTGFNVLDFFLVSHRGIIVVVPEPTSVENAYHFIKTAFFRKLKQTSPRDRVATALDRVLDNGEFAPSKTARDLVADVMAFDINVGAALLASSATFSASIVVNRAASPSDELLAADMSTACREYYGFGVEALGTLPMDPMVVKSVVDRDPVVTSRPECPFSMAIRRLALNLQGDG